LLVQLKERRPEGAQQLGGELTALRRKIRPMHGPDTCGGAEWKKVCRSG